MPNRIVVPFDTWSMQVDVPVSQLVREGGFAWSCGQCPLDAEGQVQFKDDLRRQTTLVCEYIEQIAQRGGLDAAAIAKMIVYHVEGMPGAGAAMLQILRQRFGEVPLLVPVGVPHFYYDGMMIEVDVFFGPKVRRLPTATDAETGVSIEAVEGDGLVWTLCRVANTDTGTTSSAERAETLVELLEGYGVSSRQLLSDHWFLPPAQKTGPVPTLSPIAACGLVSNQDAAAIVSDNAANDLVGDLTFVSGAANTVQTEAGGNELATTVCRRSDGFAWISTSCGDSALGLVEQTRVMMVEIEQTLTRQGMTFSNVAKLTAHYVGGATADELHGNMTVRHGFYSNPGPASTGLPVAGLNHPGSQISIDVVALA